MRGNVEGECTVTGVAESKRQNLVNDEPGVANISHESDRLISVVAV